MMGAVTLPTEPEYLPEKTVSVMQNRVNGIEDGAQECRKDLREMGRDVN